MAYLYFAKQLGIAAAFGIWACIVAKGLFAKSSLRMSPIEEAALLTPVGLAVAIGLLFGLGLAGLLTAPAVLVVAGLALAIAGWRLRDRSALGLSGTLRTITDRETRVRLIMFLIAGAVLLPVALNCLTPPYKSDEVRYHLPYALHFVEQGRIAPDLYLRYPFHTLNVNLLYAAALIFGDDVTPHFIHLLLGCFAGLALYVLAAPKCGRIIAFCTVLLFFVTPIFRKWAPSAFIDLGLAAFVTATIACLDRARGRSALAVCAGVAFGAALGTKYLALALFPLMVAWAAYRTRDGRQTARFAAVAVLVGAPWYIYNLIWTGNPISPFAGEWFGAWPWTVEDLAAETQELTQWQRPRSLSNFALMPYDLVFEHHWYRISSVPVPLAFGLMALVLLPWWSRKMLPYGILVLVVVTAWFFTAPYFRYLAAILPVWCLTSVWSVEWTLRCAAATPALRQLIPKASPRHVLYAAAAIVLAFAAPYYRWSDAVAAITERVVHRERFLREKVPVYGVAEHLRQTDAQNEVIYVHPPGALFSYAGKNRVVGDYFGPMRFREVFHNWKDWGTTPSLCSERLPKQFRGVSLIVLSRDFLQVHPSLIGQLDAWGTLEYADRHAAVFRIESSSDPGSIGPRRDATGTKYAHTAVGNDHIQIVPYFPMASYDGIPQGVVRIINHSDEAGTVMIHGIDDAGRRYGPASLALVAREIRSFNSDDWVACDFVKRVYGGVGDDQARSWRLLLETELDIESLSYVRTKNTTVATSLNDEARTTQGGDRELMHQVPLFDSGEESSPASYLRLVNPGGRDAAVRISGRDDAGEASEEEVHLSVPGGTVCWLSASELASGSSDGKGSDCGIISGRLGTGQGEWRLRVAASGSGIWVMSLLKDSAGKLVNLSTSNRTPTGRPTWGKLIDHLPLVELVRWGPRATRIGEPFKVQSNGNSALWFRFKALDQNVDYKIYFGAQPLVTTANYEGNGLSVSLTPEQSRQLISAEGKIPIYLALSRQAVPPGLVDPFRSNQLIGYFHVQPQRTHLLSSPEGQSGEALPE